MDPDVGNVLISKQNHWKGSIHEDNMSKRKNTGIVKSIGVERTFAFDTLPGLVEEVGLSS